MKKVHSIGKLFLVTLSVLSLFIIINSTVTADETTNNCNVNIAVLGDSYSSGTGARDKYGERSYYDHNEDECLRSTDGWAGQYSQYLSKHLGVNVDFSIYACAGAHIADGPKQIIKQVDHLSQDTHIVFLTAGGNDLGFFNVVMDCFVTKIYDKCQQDLSLASTALDLKGEDVKDLLNLIKEKTNGKVKVILLGYPLLVQDDWFFFLSKYKEVVAGGTTFRETDGTDRYEADEIVRDLGRKYDAIQAKVVEEVNRDIGGTFVKFVSIQELFEGHEIDPQVFFANPRAWLKEIMWDVFPDWSTCWKGNNCWDEFLDSALFEAKELFHFNDEGHDQTALFLQNSIDLSEDLSLTKQCSDPSFVVIEAPQYNESRIIDIESTSKTDIYCPFNQNFGLANNTCDTIYGLYKASSSIDIDILNGPYYGSTDELVSIQGSIASPKGSVETFWSVLDCVGELRYSSSNCVLSRDCVIDEPRAVNTTVTCRNVGKHTLALVAETSNGSLLGRETKLTIQEQANNSKKNLRTRKPPTRR